MNSILNFLISLGDDSVLIKDISLTFMKFSLIPFVFSLMKIKLIKSLKICSLESFWVILFLTNLVQLFLAHFFIMTNFSYFIVALSIAFIIIISVKGNTHENQRIN